MCKQHTPELIASHNFIHYSMWVGYLARSISHCFCCLCWMLHVVFIVLIIPKREQEKIKIRAKQSKVGYSVYTYIFHFFPIVLKKRRGGCPPYPYSSHTRATFLSKYKWFSQSKLCVLVDSATILYTYMYMQRVIHSVTLVIFTSIFMIWK